MQINSCFLRFGFLILLLLPMCHHAQFTLANGGRLDIRLYRDYPGVVFAGIFVDYYAGGDNNYTSEDITGSSNVDETILSFADDIDQRLSIDRRAEPTAVDITRLEVTRYRVTNYAIRFLINSNANGLFNGFLTPILHDKYLNTYTLLNQSDNVYFYTVEASPSSHPSRNSRRFDIVFDMPNACEEAPNVSGTPLLTSFAISTLDRTDVNALISNRNNAALLLESREKALILPRVSDETLITNPVEGMIFYDTTTNNLKVHDGNGWKILSKCD